jgi:hypothetical protein
LVNTSIKRAGVHQIQGRLARGGQRDSPDLTLLKTGTNYGQLKLFDAQKGGLKQSPDDPRMRAGEELATQDAIVFAKLRRIYRSIQSLSFSPAATCWSLAAVPVPTKRSSGIRGRVN